MQLELPDLRADIHPVTFDQHVVDEVLPRALQQILTASTRNEDLIPKSAVKLLRICLPALVEFH